MTKIKQYELDSTIHEDDKVIGTDGNPGVDLGRTKNFTIAALTAYLNTALEVDNMIGGSGTLNTIPMWTPDGTTLGDSIISRDPLVVSPDNAILIAGKLRIDTTGSSGTDVGPIAAFSTSIAMYKDVLLQAGLSDYSNSLGTSGQVLTSTGTAVSWVDVSSLSGNVDGSGTLNTIAMWTPDGNTLGDSIILYDSDPSNDAIEIAGKLSIDSTGSASDVGPIADFTSNISFYKDLYLTQGLRDSANNLGASGQILSSTGTATQWINNTVIPANNIVGSGTLNYLAMFTPDGSTVGDSIIFKRPDANELIVGTYPSGQSGPNSVIGEGYMSVTGGIGATTVTATNINGQNGGTVTLDGDVNIGNADTDVLTVTSTSTFNNNVTLGSDDDDEIVVEGTLELQGPVKDHAATLGTAGKILISDSSGQLSFGDQIDTTYTYSSAQDGSDVVLTLTDGTTPQDISLVAGNSITLTDNGNNDITIAATGGAANTEYDLASAQNGSNIDISLTGTDATTDTVSLIAGTNVTLTDNGSNNITINASPAVTYDLVGTYNTTDTILTLQGSDATSDTFTLHAGSGISFGQDAVNGITTIGFDLSTSGAVGGSGTLNTIPLWTPDGDTLGDSNITLSQGNVGIGTATPSKELHVNGDVLVTGDLEVQLDTVLQGALDVIGRLEAQGQLHIQDELLDQNSSSGSSDYILKSTGTGNVEWVNPTTLPGVVSGTGTAGKLPYWNPDGTTLADSLITQTSDNSITIGVGATATGSEAISLSRSEARADYSFAHGYESITDGEFSVTLGKGGYTAGDHSAAIGYKGISLGQSAISGGHSSSAGGDGAVALGHNASAGNYGVAKATSTFPNDQTTFDIYGIVGTVAVGTFLRYGPGFDVADPRIEVTQFTDLGNGSATITLASGIRPIQGELLVFEEQTPQRNDHQGGVALGNDAFSLGQGAVALGQDAVASADFAVAIGKGATTSTQDTIAMGGDSTKILIEALVSASSYANDTEAAAGGVAIGELYRNGNVVQIRLT